MKPVSDEFIQCATLLLAEELRRFDDDLTYEDSVRAQW